MDPYAQAASRIIKQQQAIIGPIALDQAKHVAGIEFTNVDEVKITGKGKDVLTNLVNQYAKIFGKASIEVCKEAFASVADKIPANEVPDVLKG